MRPQNGAHFGSSLTAWNFGRNEQIVLLGRTVTLVSADLAIGVPDRTIGTQTQAGAVDIFYGSAVPFSNGLVTTNRQVLTANSIGLVSTAFAHFGAAIY